MSPHHAQYEDDGSYVGLPTKTGATATAEGHNPDAMTADQLVDNYKLAELQELADARNVDYANGATKAQVAEAIVASQQPADDGDPTPDPE